jgi:DNA-binding LacI/PurR family transcriptional regulator
VYRRRSGFAERTLDGVKASAAAHGVRMVHRPCQASHEAAAGTITRVLEDRPGTTGLIVQNEAVIPPLLSVLRTTGRMVPEDMSVVALCPDQVAEQTSPRLTSVRIPAEAMGRWAVELLMRRPDDGRAGELVLLPPELTVRGSTAPASR